MRPATLAHLYLIRLRSRLGAEFLALGGIAVGVALVFAALVASTSLTGSVRQLSEGIVGDADLQLAARGPAGFDERALRQMRDIDHVDAAAGVVETKANLIGPKSLRSVLLIGPNRSLARVGGSLLQAPVLAREAPEHGLTLPAPLAAQLGVGAGDSLRVETGFATVRTEVAGKLGRADVGSLVESPVALAPPSLVRKLGDMPGRVSRVFVDAAPGLEGEVEEGLRRIAGNRLNVSAADQEVAIFERAAYPTDRSTALFSALSALVGFLFALSAILLTVPGRRRLIADLRMAGYAPPTVIQILLFDALALGIAGVLLGLALGDQASQRLFGDVPNHLTSAFAVGTQRIVTWQSVAIASAAGILAAAIAVLAPIRSSLYPRPRQPSAVAVASARKLTLTAAGCGLLALTAAIAVLVPHLALVGVGSLTAALLLLLPALIRLAAQGFERAGLRTKSPATILAVLELRAGSAGTRTLALAATGAIAVFATVSIGGARADLQRGLDAVARDIDRGAQAWAAFRGPTNIFASVPIALTPERIAAIERLPEVRRVEQNGGAFLDIGDHRAWVLAQSGSGTVPTSQIRDGEAELASARVSRGGWLTLSEDLADQFGVEVGQRVVLPTPVASAFRVAAISTNLGWPGGAIVMNAADYRKAWDSAVPSSLGIEGKRGISAAAVARAVERALADRPSLRVETRSERTARQQAVAQAGLAQLEQISAMVLIAAVLAMVASMGGAIWQRRSTFAALKVQGLEESTLWRALLLESSLLLGTGCALGASFGLLGQLLLDRALEVTTGLPVFYAVAIPTALAVFLLLTSAAVVMLAVPGRLAVRVRPTAEGLRPEA